MIIALIISSSLFYVAIAGVAYHVFHGEEGRESCRFRDDYSNCYCALPAVFWPIFLILGFTLGVARGGAAIAKLTERKLKAKKQQPQLPEAKVVD